MDLIHWQSKFVGPNAAKAAEGFVKAHTPFVSTGVVTPQGGKATLIVRDPDGHAVQFSEQ